MLLTFVVPTRCRKQRMDSQQGALHIPCPWAKCRFPDPTDFGASTAKMALVIQGPYRVWGYSPVVTKKYIRNKVFGGGLY